jgi:uncharacterized protein
VQNIVVLAIVGLLAQLIDGSLGMAYGATSATLLLSFGLSPAVASASIHLAEVGTTLASGTAHWRFGNVDWQVVRRIGVPGAVGGFLGAVVLSSISTAAATPWMAGVLLAIGIYILLRFTFGRAHEVRAHRPLRSRFLAPLGLVAGFVDATGGGGWGPVATPSLLVSGRMEPRKVIGSVDTSEFLVASAASVGFLLGLGRAGLDVAVVGALLIGGLIAAPIAAWLVRHLAPRLLGASVGGLLVVTNARTMLGQFRLPDQTRTTTYVALFAAWAAALAWALATHRREQPLVVETAEADERLAA